MFSGAGIFADGLMIALVVDGVIFLKADDGHIPAFEGEGLRPFSYKRKEGRAHDDVVLADARTALRRSGRTCAMGAAVDGGGPAVGDASQAARPGQRKPRAKRRRAEVKTDREVAAAQATLASPAAENSGSVSQITRLRPLRLAA